MRFGAIHREVLNRGDERVGTCILLGLATSPILVTTFEPIGEIHLRDWVGHRRLDGFEAFDYGVVGVAIIEPLINQSSSRGGQACDFAVARVLMPAEELVHGV